MEIDIYDRVFYLILINSFFWFTFFSWVVYAACSRYVIWGGHTIFWLPVFCKTLLPKIVKIQQRLHESVKNVRGCPFLRHSVNTLNASLFWSYQVLTDVCSIIVRVLASKSNGARQRRCYCRPLIGSYMWFPILHHVCWFWVTFIVLTCCKPFWTAIYLTVVYNSGKISTETLG